MLVYTCVKRFFLSPLGRYMPVGSEVWKWENNTKLSFVNWPASDQDPFNSYIVRFEYNNPKVCTWFETLEPPPFGKSTLGYFEFKEQHDEDIIGGGLFGGGVPIIEGCLRMRGDQGNLYCVEVIEGPLGPKLQVRGIPE